MNELHAYTSTGLTLYAVRLNSTGQAWNGSTHEEINGANWTDYDIPLTEAAAGIYLADMPTATAGVYSYLVYEQVGASPATTDTLRGNGSLVWDGSTEVLPASQTSIDNLPTTSEFEARTLPSASYLSSGSGSETVTLTIEHNSTVVANAAVWVTTDSAGANVIAGTKYSNMNGLVTFYLDAGTYYVWATKSGIDFGNPNQIVVV